MMIDFTIDISALKSDVPAHNLYDLMAFTLKFPDGVH